MYELIRPWHGDCSLCENSTCAIWKFFTNSFVALCCCTLYCFICKRSPLKPLCFIRVKSGTLRIWVVPETGTATYNPRQWRGKKDDYIPRLRRDNKNVLRKGISTTRRKTFMRFQFQGRFSSERRLSYICVCVYVFSRKSMIFILCEQSIEKRIKSIGIKFFNKIVHVDFYTFDSTFYLLNTVSNT